MPRYTAIFITNANYHRVTLTPADIAQHIRTGNFRHEPTIDFATEVDALEILSRWTMHPSRLYFIVRYELLNNDNYQILGFTNIFDGTHYAFQEQFSFPSVYSEIIGARMMRPERQELAPGALTTRVVAPPVLLNEAQSTHTASVHKSVTESLQRLNRRYAQMDIDKNIAAIKKFAQQINAQNLPETSQLEREAAIRFIARMDTMFGNKEAGSKLTIKHILALVWEGAHDQKNGALKCDIKTVEESFVKHLYEIQRGYNLDLLGCDLGGEDKPICAGGTINKLTDTLNAGIHEDVEIIYITKETAGEKLKAMMKEMVVAFVKNSSQKEELITQINNSKTLDKVPTWNIPELILNEIQFEVKKSFFDEFQSSLMPEQLEEIFSQYEFISLDEDSYKKLSEEKPPFNHITEEDEKAEIDEVSLYSNTNAFYQEVSLEAAATEQAELPAQINRQSQLKDYPPSSRGSSFIAGIYRLFSAFNPSSVCQVEEDLPRAYRNSN